MCLLTRPSMLGKSMTAPPPIDVCGRKPPVRTCQGMAKIFGASEALWSSFPKPATRSKGAAYLESEYRLAS